MIMSLISQAIQRQDNQRYTPGRCGILCTTDFRPDEAKFLLPKASRRQDHEAASAVVLKDQIMTIHLNRELTATVLTQTVSAATRLFCSFTRPFTIAKVYDDE
jgi:hypothetical protein